jgi:CTP synthase
MTIILVEHRTPDPALDGMIAGELAGLHAGTLVHTVSGGGGLDRFDSVQHVLRDGALAPNGLVWFERRTGLPVGLAVDRGAVAVLPDPVVVVAVNPAVAAQREAAERIAVTAARLGRAVERVQVTDDGPGFRLEGGDGPAHWVRDRYGRPSAAPSSARPAGDTAVRILVIGDERLQREVYPANLAALGDAADALSVAVAVRFADPRYHADDALAAAVEDADGVLLPGGSDMEQVAGQVAAARMALRRDVPAVGLCLGMQSMCTAAAQVLAGLDGANLAEADPAAPIKTFVRLTDVHGRPEFRLGARRMRVVAGTRLADLAGPGPLEVRCNHRFVLDPALHDRLFAAGLVASGWHADRDLVDAIELPGHRFYMGQQGHPELSSRPGAPAPLIAGFLAAAAGITGLRATAGVAP